MKFPSLADQKEDPLSLLNWFRNVIRVRNAFPVIARGRVEEAEGLCSDHIAAFFKTAAEETPVLILINIGTEEQNCDLSGLNGTWKLSAVLNTSEEAISSEQNSVVLPGFSIAVLTEG